MKRKGKSRFLKPVGNPADPDGLVAFMQRYLDHRRVLAATDQTLYNLERYLRDFIAWCDVRGLERPTELTKPILEAYQRHLHYYRKANGEPLSFASQRGKLVPVRGFFKWLTRANHLLYNPASELELPRLPRRLPRFVLSIEEVESVMRQPDTGETMGLRDRAMLETLYSTGMRRMEIVNLQVSDLDLDRGTVLIRQGKGRKDRMIPIGERALDWIGRYLARARLHLVCPPDTGVLFLTREGEAFNPEWLSNIVARYVDAASTGKRGACHLFRHTMATLMLEGGADIRFIQAMLGHAELSTTQIYTQVAIRQLKQIHSATHPADARLRAAQAEQEARRAGRQDALDVAQLLAHLDDEELEDAATAVRH